MKKFYNVDFAILMVLINLTCNIFASSADDYVLYGLEDRSHDDQKDYPINAPSTATVENKSNHDANKTLEKIFANEMLLPKKSQLFVDLETIFKAETSILSNFAKNTDPLDRMKILKDKFKLFPVTATDEQLQPTLLGVFNYLDAFCFGYRNVFELFKEQLIHHKRELNSCDSSILYLNEGSDEQPLSMVDLVLSISMNLDGSQKLSNSTEQALRKITKHRIIKEWINNILDSRPIKVNFKRTAKMQVSVEGMHAAIDEISYPSLLSAHSRNEGGWHWYAQIFSVRNEGLKSLRKHLAKPDKPDQSLLVPKAQTPTTKTDVGSKKSWMCCFRPQ